MPVRSTLELGDPLLRQLALPVSDVSSAETQALLIDLWDTLADLQQRFSWCHALSAPVIGVAQRVIVLDSAGQRLTLINPTLVSWGRSQELSFENCLTFNQIWGQVYRPAQIVVAALDADGAAQQYEMDGVIARTIQHELDHLDGLVWLDREPDPATICTTNEYMRMALGLPPASQQR